MTHRTNPYLLILGLVTAVSCGQATDDLVLPGQTTTEIGNLRYHYEEVDGSDAVTIEVTTCSMARDMGSLAILRYTGTVRTESIHDDCSGPYGATAVLRDMEVLAVAAGEPLPRQLTTVSLESFIQVPKDGDAILVTLREADNEWFVRANLPVDINAQGDLTPVTGENVNVTLPPTFAGLHAEAAEAYTNLPRRCPVQAERRASDAEFRRLMKDPSARNCEPNVEESCTDPDCPDYVAPACEDDRFCLE